MIQVSNFEYTNQSFTYKLIALSLLGFALVVFTSGYTAPLIGTASMIFTAFAVGIITFMLNKKKIKQHGSVVITESYVEFTLPGSVKRIEYEEIKKYQLEHYNAVRISIRLRTGEKFLLVGNPNFCNPQQLASVAIALDKQLIDFRRKNNGALERKGNVVEIINKIVGR